MRRDTAIAAVMSFIVPGVGQLYAGQLKRGVLCCVLFVMWLFIYMTMVIMLPFSLFTILLFYMGSFTARIIAAVDAALTAKRESATFQPKGYNKWYVYVGLIVTLSVINPSFLIPLSMAGGGESPYGFDGEHSIAGRPHHNKQNGLQHQYTNHQSCSDDS